MGRVDRYLEGDLARTDLTPDEQAEAGGMETLIEAARAYVTARPDPDLTARVMARIDTAHPQRMSAWQSVVARLRGTLWTSRRVSFHVRPAYVLLGAVLVVSGVVQWGYLYPRSRPATADAAPLAPAVLVQFRLDAPAAATVRLAGSFTNWEATHELHQTAPGIWTITLPVPLGVHDYAFVVDGSRWVADPHAPHVDDGFGGTNSRLALLLVSGPQM